VSALDRVGPEGIPHYKEAGLSVKSSGSSWLCFPGCGLLGLSFLLTNLELVWVFWVLLLLCDALSRKTCN
jgi:hypothetical protein